ncbi:MAG TPA: NAD-binding protein [Thermoanaerobaculia bacterium]|nr:NAD-binding protein [Thermoanaerobaculia bacterium]
MKFLPSEIAYLLTEGEIRSNLRALGKYLAFLAGLIALYTVLFHWIMWEAEGVRHTWLTGLYWTLTVMTTLGFGDITFQSDVGRAFSLLVLLSGVVFLLIVLPFAFIRFFYAPWLEARIRQRAPRAAPARLAGHVILCRYDDIARMVIERLRILEIPHLVLEPDPAVAANLFSDGVSVVVGDLDAVETYVAAGAPRARALVANVGDAANTNITLTVREVAAELPIVAIVEEDDSEDILQLAGATHVLPLKRQLGEQLAIRVSAGHAHAHVIGRFKDLLIAEFPVHGTPLAGRTIRDARLRDALGVNVIGVWERGRLRLARPDTVLTDVSVPVVVGTVEQITELDTYLVIYDVNFNPVLVLGGGKVGSAAAGFLKRNGMPVRIVERDPSIERYLQGFADEVIVGDAADREVMDRAGIAEAPSVLLSTNDDATNIYLAVYCRRLNPNVRIVSRITHERNLESIHRAGADLVLSFAGLAIESVTAVLQGRELVLLGQGVEFFALPVTSALDGKTLAQSAIGARTGINVIGINDGADSVVNPPATRTLEAGQSLLAVGTAEQRAEFAKLFGAGVA